MWISFSNSNILKPELLKNRPEEKFALARTNFRRKNIEKTKLRLITTQKFVKIIKEID